MDTPLPLFVDLYELTMAQAYFFENFQENAVFSTFVRKLPQNRNFLVACGLDNVLNFLENFRFTPKEIDFLHSLKIFKDAFLDYLKELKFTGDVYGLKEGTIFFENEPILEIVAPIIQGQILETYILNQIQFQTIIATKGARIYLASKDKDVVDFGSRRAHGLDAGIKAARAFYISGMKATSNVEAGRRYNLPVTGTMAHSYIQVHSDEFSAFKEFAKLYPKTILLIDTYSIEQGVQNVIKLARTLGDKFQVQGVRIDSNDLIKVSREVRKNLDEAGLSQIKIFVSGGLDEYKIQEIICKNAPIDGFGVGTRAIVSEDTPFLDIVYKLTQYNKEGKFKTSRGKATIPFQKQIFRFLEGGKYKKDILALYKEKLPGKPLLIKVMEKGKRTKEGRDELEQIRIRFFEELKKLPESLLDLTKAKDPYPITLSPALQKELSRLKDNSQAPHFNL